uniref:Caskin-1 n=1 Tax=Loa loa TaxID=7209 RepID=A0A1I7VFS2_LOALO
MLQSERLNESGRYYWLIFEEIQIFSKVIAGEIFRFLSDCLMNMEKECQENLITVSPSSSVSLKQRFHYINRQNSDNLSCNGCHRNSADFNSSHGSHGSSSGFESMKSGSSYVCSAGGIQGAIGSNSSFLRTSSTVSGSSSGLLAHNSQSRLSMQSSSSGDASLITNNMSNVFDNSGAEYVRRDNLGDISRLSFSDMMLKGMSEAEILAQWLGSLGYPEYLRAFLTQGYDLSTIARITSEDLTALGITHPIHRKLLISEIHTWRITDTWPTLIPSGELREWLPLIGLPEYVTLFEKQGYCRIGEIQNFTWEDFEDIGIKKLGHLKRLGLAIKKIKAHEFGRIQPNGGSQRLGFVAVHHNKIDSQAVYNGLRSHLTPPPPAPTSTFHPASLSNLCENYYIIGKQHSHLRKVFPPESHAQKQVVQVCPHYQSTAANETGPYHLQRFDGQSLESGLNKQETGSLQMNLCSFSRILPVESLQKHSAIQQQLFVLPAKILSTAENSTSSDSEDYPPPPAPLACEGSIQLLRAFHESAMAATAVSGTADGSNFEKQYNESTSFSANDQSSLAKDNCGTIKGRVGLPLRQKCCETSTNTSFSQPKVPRRSYSTSANNDDVLNGIGCMLQNLTDELDAMLLPSKSLRHSYGGQVPF